MVYHGNACVNIALYERRKLILNVLELTKTESSSSVGDTCTHVRWELKDHDGGREADSQAGAG